LSFCHKTSSNKKTQPLCWCLAQQKIALLSTKACVTIDVLEIYQNFTTSSASKHMNIKQGDGNCEQLHPWHLSKAEALKLSITTRHLTIQFLKVQIPECHILAKHIISQDTNVVTDLTGKEPTLTFHMYKRLSIWDNIWFWN
jgi:hypothetical protein